MSAIFLYSVHNPRTLLKNCTTNMKKICTLCRQATAQPSNYTWKSSNTCSREILQNLNRCSVFSRLALKFAFHQRELSEHLKNYICYAQSLLGYKPLVFDVSCAPYMYQRIISKTLVGCTWVGKIFDDIIVNGKTKMEHDRKLKGLLQKLREKDLTLNFDNCQFDLSEIDFMGYLLFVCKRNLSWQVQDWSINQS